MLCRVVSLGGPWPLGLYISSLQDPRLSQSVGDVSGERLGEKPGGALLETRLASEFVKRNLLCPGSFGRVGYGFRRPGPAKPREKSPRAGAEGGCQTGRSRKHRRRGKK